MFKILFSFFILVISNDVFAQQEKIDADRPGETVSPGIVPLRYLQFETGLVQQADKTGASKNIVFQHPELVTRVALVKRFEIRTLTTFATEKESVDRNSERHTGFSDLELGAKYQLTEGNKGMPEVSVFVLYDFKNWRSIDRDTVNGFHARILLENKLSHKISFEYNGGIRWETFDSAPEYIYTLSPKFEITDKLTGFVELYGKFKHHKAPEEVADASLAWFLSKGIMLDATVGFGLNRHSPENYFSFGGSFRIKTTHHN